MRALALGGAGAVCREATRDLAAFSDFDEIVVAEQDVAAAELLVAQINDSRLKMLPFDANDYEEMLRTFPAYDVIMNGLPYQFDLPVNRACVEVGVSGLDISSDDPQFEFHNAALEQGITFVPGIKNVGIPLSIGAQMLANGQVEAKGVVPPEIAFPPQAFFEELAKRGIQVEEEIEERGPLAS